jgi:hypothetical protein
MAKKSGSIYIGNSLHRIPDAGKETKLGAPIKYLAQNEFASSLIRERFERGDPASFCEIITALRIQYSTAKENKKFQIVMKSDHSLRVWLRRLLKRMQFSERLGTISQKVPADWVDVAKATSARIRQAAIDLGADDVLSADETFIQFHSSDRVLVPTGTKRVGSVVSADNEKKGITLMVTASLLSSTVLPPFIIDTGEYGADLMHQWKHYTKSTVIFNKNHWMNSVHLHSLS